MKPILQRQIPIKFNRDRIKNQTVIIHFWLLLLWIALGSVLRFSYLDGKTVWSDEWATIVFSLGHSFHSIPLDRVISLSTLLEPLRIDNSNAGEVVSHLMSESTHPPLYFVLSNWWLKFADNGELVSIWLARSLSVIFGVLAIPAMFGLGWLSYNSLLVGQLAAGLMTVSPYGIYLAQETRHYTLVILWVIASLCCWVITIRQRSRQQVPRRSLMLVWILVNSLGIATHYFFGLNLLAQTLVLLTLWWQDRNKAVWLPFWRRISIAILGTIAGCAVWVLSWQYFPDTRLTEWTQQDPTLSLELLFPIGRLLTWILAMFVLPPVEGVAIWVTIASLVVLLPVVFWLIKAAWQYFRISNDPVERAIASFIAISLILNLVFAYILGRDLTIAARFQYFYFPAVLVLGAAILGRKWQLQGNLVIAVLLSGFLGGMVVVGNYGFQKSDRPDLVVPVIAEVNQLAAKNASIVIATVHKTHEQTGEMMGLGWEWQRKYPLDNNNDSSPSTPQFLLLHVEENYRTVTSNLYRFLEQSSRPLDLWLVNFSASTILKYHSLKSQGCIVSPDYELKVSGYRFNHYYCQEKPVDARKNFY